MTNSPLSYLASVLGHIQQESFGRRDAPQVRLSPDAHENADGSVSGALEIYIRTRAGEEPLIQREPFEGLKSKTEIDDLLARTLSVLLMNHTDWPR
jgi:hypothetical protein